MSTSPPPGPDSAAQRIALESAAAQRDALVDVAAILAHDLSNPLQSITVLCELGFDDAPAGSDERKRFEQMLQAADRMRGLVHGFAGLARSQAGRSTLTDVVDRAVTLLDRRFERHRMVVSRRLAVGGDANVTPDFEFCLLTALLGIVCAADEHQRPSHELNLLTTAESGNLFVSIEGIAKAPGADPLPLSVPPRHLARCRAAARDAVGIEEKTGGLRLGLGRLHA